MILILLYCHTEDSKSEHAFLLDFDIEKAIFFRVLPIELSDILIASSDLVAYLDEEALLFLNAQESLAYVFDRHKNAEIALHAYAA